MSKQEGATAEPLSVLEIHLDRIRRNYQALQKMLARGADCAAVVKADAYGLGATNIVPELHRANCRHFYVAYATEGLTVRAALAGREAHIYVLHGPHGIDLEELARKNLIPVLNTPDDIEYWTSFAKKGGERLPAVVHIDTGMNRLGLSVSDVAWLQKNTGILKPLDVRYVMSHLACADQADHPKNKEQLEKFKQLTASLAIPCRLSFANSAGVFLGNGYHFDQVRPGCALYGLNPQNTLLNPMQGVVTLKARILQTKNSSAGETVGYGAAYVLPKAAVLATISAGYADGYLRNIAGNGIVYIHGQACPVVGRISMDLIVADVTQVKARPVAGDWAEIIGQHQTVDDVALQAKTLGYEILTSLGRRYRRIYSGHETA